jgi:adenosylcobinamide kinase/adenosylcobinamide-phosphate guanylyltransferase
VGKITLVLGGARSGKSEFAERMVDRPSARVSYIATARQQGREMVARIERHQKRRPSSWQTIEAPSELRAAIDKLEPDTQAVMIECLYVWTSNRLLALGDPAERDWWDRVAELEVAVVAETREVATVARDAPWDLVFVSSEIGLGTVPEQPRPRAFRDLVGTVNRTAADCSSEVYIVIAGIPVELTRLRARM